MAQTSKLSTRVIVAFACVYVFWGSTYLAIRIGVEVLPPFLLASSRYLISGPLMLALCAMRGMSLRITWRQAAVLAAIGVLLLSGGNMGLVWCEQYISSGLAALIVAVVPLYVALFEIVLPGGESLRARGWVGMMIGFAGLIIVLSPGVRDSLNGDHRQLLGGGVALVCALAWSAGSVLARRSKLSVSPFVAAGWEMTFAGIFNTLILFATGGSLTRAHWGVQAWGSVLYLVTFGSLVGYTAYIYLLDHVPVAKVSTYAYVNPVVAVILGALLLHERFLPIEWLGMAAIVIAVFLVTSSKLKNGTPTAAIECGPTESQA